MLFPSIRLVMFAAGAVVARSAPAQSPASQDGVAITFITNEGVMLSGGGKKVLIDALFLPYKTYAVPADSTQAVLSAARAPFDAVDLILATHYHGDHYHPAQVAAHMRANPRATLITSQQVIDSMRGRVPANDPIRSRIMARTTPRGERRRETVNGITVELVGLPHGSGLFRNREVEHLAYIVEIGGRRVLHVGDVSDTEKTFASFRLDTARIDVALLPDWMVTSEEGRRVVERLIRPKHIVAIHLDGDSPGRPTQVAPAGAVTYMRRMETRRF